MVLSDTDVTISGIELLAPGDSVTYTFYVENKGTIPAKLSTNTTKNPTVNATGEGAEADKTLVENNYEYKIVWENDSSTIAPGDKLAAGDKKKIKVTITYKSEAPNLPTEKVTISGLGTTLLYEQDTDA